MSRLASLRDRTFDVAIVGGGIIGAGIARDAALRGYSVALFERRDYGGGTTSGSTRLIHGGLRYLEMLDFGLVRMDLREREILLRIAPHLVRPLPFLLPFYQRSLFYRLKMRIGLWLYDLLSYDKSLPSRRTLSAAEVRAMEPALEPRGLQGAAMYYDAQASLPERLCLENILDARAHGAAAFNYAEVVGALHDGDRLAGLRVRDTLAAREAAAGDAASGARTSGASRAATGSAGAAAAETAARDATGAAASGASSAAGAEDDGDIVDVRARVVVNASGPWFDRVAGRLTATHARRIRTTKGVHFAVPSMATHAMSLFSPLDERLVFVIPWLGYTWIGTTDTDFTDDPATARATHEDMAYVLESVRPFFPQVTPESIVFSNAGVRALVMEEGDESSVSRAHQVVADERAGAPGLVSVLGGKLTGYRAIAEEATDIVSKKLDPQGPRACRTADDALPGGRYEAGQPRPGAGNAANPGNAGIAVPASRGAGRPVQAGQVASASPSFGGPDASYVDPDIYEDGARLYGARLPEVLRLAAANPRLAERLAPGCPVIAAQVVFAIREEQCLRLVDFMLRRTDLGFSRDQGRAAAPAAAALMAGELGWDDATLEAELAAFDHELDATQRFRLTPA